MNDPSQEDYTVRLEVFEGPLDLLLYLIRKDEVDIYDIPIVDITKQYNKYIDLMRMLDLDIAGEFLVMSATLMLIKSRMLLPVEERPEEEEDDDPRLDLVRQLIEYKKFKDAADHLGDLEDQQQNVFYRFGDGVHLERDPNAGLAEVGIFDLIAAFNNALKRVEEEKLHEIFNETYTVADKIDDLMVRVKDRKKLSVNSLFVHMKSRSEIICTFLAVLELIRLKHIRAEQDTAFDEIFVVQNNDSDERINA